MAETAVAILSHAHDWMQRLPLTQGLGVCMRCGTEAPLLTLGAAPKCEGHFEHIGSAFGGPIVFSSGRVGLLPINPL